VWQLQTVRGRLYTRASRLLPCRLPSKNLPKSWTELARHTGHPSGDGWDWEPTGIEPTRVAKHVSDAPRAHGNSSVHLIILIFFAAFPGVSFQLFSPPCWLGVSWPRSMQMQRWRTNKSLLAWPKPSETAWHSHGMAWDYGR
jgi:hypothetical protein